MQSSHRVNEVAEVLGNLPLALGRGGAQTSGSLGGDSFKQTP